MQVSSKFCYCFRERSKFNHNYNKMLCVCVFFFFIRLNCVSFYVLHFIFYSFFKFIFCNQSFWYQRCWFSIRFSYVIIFCSIVNHISLEFGFGFIYTYGLVLLTLFASYNISSKFFFFIIFGCFRLIIEIFFMHVLSHLQKILQFVKHVKENKSKVYEREKKILNARKNHISMQIVYVLRLLCGVCVCLFVCGCVVSQYVFECCVFVCIQDSHLSKYYPVCCIRSASSHCGSSVWCWCFQ